MKLVEELDYQFDFDQLKNKNPCWPNPNPLVNRFQGLSLQHRPLMYSPWNMLDGLESLKWYGNNCSETDFNVVHETFKNTEYERIITDFKLVRSRLMILVQSTNYSLHRDHSCRLHIPIKTNSNCLFFFPEHNKHFHLEEGKIYKVNTKENHTFINLSGEPRIHFIGCMYE